MKKQNKKEKLGVWILGNILIYSLLAFQIADFHKDIQEPIQYLVINHAEAYYGVGEPQALPAKTEILSPAGQAENHTVEEGSSMEAGDAGGTLQNQRSDASVSIEELIRETFPEDPETAVAVAKCESQLDPSRIGDTHMTYPSYGLFQINRTWHKQPIETLLDAEKNIEIARGIYDEGGWERWSCYRFNFYLAYL